MCEKRILIAALLKPVNDTRLYEKLGMSLAKLPQTEVHVAGFAAPLPVDAPANLFFHPVFNFKRLGLDRLQAQFIFFRLLLRLRPAIVIVSTHELLPLSCLYKLFYPCRVMYDVRENYALNLRAQFNYPWVIKNLLALAVRGIERMLAPCIVHFLVAEHTYLKELPFLRHRATLIENKFKPDTDYKLPQHPVRLQNQPLRLLYSGTISEIYGIFEAISLADQLHQLYPNTRLTIIGYCAHTATLEKLQSLVSQRPYITLVGGNILVPHRQIIDQIKKSNVGLLPYQPNESTFRCVPTKLYEYMAHALPLLLQENPLWTSIAEQAGAGAAINFKSPDMQRISKLLSTGIFYNQGIPDFIWWKTEEAKLILIVREILNLQNNFT